MNKKILVLIDCQHDFIDGSLANPEAQKKVKNIVKKIDEFDGDAIIYTLDTHDENYLESAEGKKLPVTHCVKYTDGWNLNDDIANAITRAVAREITVVDVQKPTFGSFDVPVEVKKKKETIVFDTDEGPRASTIEGLAKLRPINPDGYVTAGNASGINDGAAALVIMSEEKANELGVKPMATFVAGALAGVDPSIMGIGPVAATKKAMAKAGYKIEDFDIIEANEAFAAQSVAVGKDLGIDVEKQLNPNGGAIALGHPVGASGARILVTLLHEMKAKGAKKGLATLCIGGGMGCATIVEM